MWEECLDRYKDLKQVKPYVLGRCLETIQGLSHHELQSVVSELWSEVNDLKKSMTLTT